MTSVEQSDRNVASEARVANLMAGPDAAALARKYQDVAIENMERGWDRLIGIKAGVLLPKHVLLHLAHGVARQLINE